MGKTITPKYALYMTGTSYYMTPSAWKGRVPSPEKLEQEVMGYVVSTMPGFANEHIGEKFGIQIPSYACVKQNKPGGLILVEWRAPMFQVLPDPKDYPKVAKSFRSKVVEVEQHVKDATGVPEFDPEESMTPSQIEEVYDEINRE